MLTYCLGFDKKGLFWMYLIASHAGHIKLLKLHAFICNPLKAYFLFTQNPHHLIIQSAAKLSFSTCYNSLSKSNQNEIKKSHFYNDFTNAKYHIKV